MCAHRTGRALIEFRQTKDWSEEGRQSLWWWSLFRLSSLWKKHKGTGRRENPRKLAAIELGNVCEQGLFTLEIREDSKSAVDWVRGSKKCGEMRR